MDASQLFYFWISFFANLLWAAALFALGLLLGWLIWNGRREKLERRQEENARLREEYQMLCRTVRDNT